MMKKVILITSTFSNEKKGGVPSFVENRALYLSKRLDVTVYGLGESYVDGQVSFKSIGRSSHFKYFFLLYWLRLIFICFRNRSSIIETHNIPVSFPLFFIFKCRYFFHGPSRLEAQMEGSSLGLQKLKYFIEKACLKSAKKIFVVSKSFHQLLLKEHGRNLPHISQSLPKFKYDPSYFNDGIPKSKSLNFVIVRRLVKRTGVLPFVHLFFEMLESKVIPEDCRLDIAGDGPEKEELVNLIENSPFKNQVNYLGLISESKKIELFNHADFHIVPSLSLEGFGLVIIEAGICGCMSIVTNVGGMPEVIEYLSNQGIVYDLDRKEAIRIFSGLAKHQYDKKKLHEITKKAFYFESCNS